MTGAVSFAVFGVPRPKGSKRAFIPKGGTRPVMVESAGENLRDWMTALHAVAQEHAPRALTGALRVDVRFAMPRPKSHYRASGALKDGVPTHRAKSPDVDKLLRAVLDALEGPLFANDAQVVEISGEKTYSDDATRCGAYITVGPIEEG